jgi:hypothetical protein
VSVRFLDDGNALLDAIPEFLVDDVQRFVHGDAPFLRWPCASQALIGARLFDEATPIPHDPARV